MVLKVIFLLSFLEWSIPREPHKADEVSIGRHLVVGCKMRQLVSIMNKV